MVPSLEKRIAELEATGWKRRNAGAFMDMVGPLWARSEGGCRTYGLIAQDPHLNPAKVVHGGVLQSLIDHALSAIAWQAVGRRPCMTVQADSQFLAAVESNDFIMAEGAEIHRTRSLIFMRGQLRVKDKQVLSAQSIFKIVG